jgi:hypothetical protein
LRSCAAAGADGATDVGTELPGATLAGPDGLGLALARQPSTSTAVIAMAVRRGIEDIPLDLDIGLIPPLGYRQVLA